MRTRSRVGSPLEPHVDRLVSAEPYGSPQEAMDREKQSKGGSRRKKIELIECSHPTWRDLSDDLERGDCIARLLAGSR